jgi:hypothetical protein
MRMRLLLLLLAGAGVASVARADLDLSPTESIHTLDQIKFRHVTFHDGAKEITYEPPKNWTCTGSHSAAALSIPEHPQARAFIQSAPKLRIPAFDDKAAKLFQDNPLLLQLPKGAKGIKITGVTVNPLVIDAHPTMEIDATYNFFGQACARSILLVNRNGAEVSCVLDCLAPDFDVLNKQFRRSLFTFVNL